MLRLRSLVVLGLALPLSAGLVRLCAAVCFQGLFFCRKFPLYPPAFAREEQDTHGYIEMHGAQVIHESCDHRDEAQRAEHDRQHVGANHDFQMLRQVL